MPYAKGTWVNNVTPANATNMTRIEDGVYDNSIKIDDLETADSDNTAANETSHSDVLVDSDTVSPVTPSNKILTESDATGGGDMLKSVYDADNDGVVDAAYYADNAGDAVDSQRLGGYLPSHFMGINFYDSNEDGVVDFADESNKLGGQLPSYYLTKVVYDTDDSGIVDNSEKLGGQLPSYYAVAANYVLKTGGIFTDSTIFGDTGENPNSIFDFKTNLRASNIVTSEGYFNAKFAGLSSGFLIKHYNSDDSAGTASFYMDKTALTFETKSDGVYYDDTSRLLGSDTSADTGSDQIKNIVSLTQSEYNALTPVSTTFYVIVG